MLGIWLVILIGTSGAAAAQAREVDVRECVGSDAADQDRDGLSDSCEIGLRVLARDRPPLPYTEELWEDGMQPYRELHENFPGSQCEPRSPVRPQYRAALRHILFDDTGRMWVEATVEDGFLWEVFDTEGRLLGAVPAPERATEIPPYVRDNHLYQVETDELNIQYISVYRIETES